MFLHRFFVVVASLQFGPGACKDLGVGPECPAHHHLYSCAYGMSGHVRFSEPESQRRSC